MSKDFSQSASSEQSEPKWPFTVRRRDTSVLKNDPANLCIAYLAADSALSSAKPGTSAEELSKMRMRSSDALKNWREADDLWEQRLDDLVSTTPRDSSGLGTEPIHGKCYEAEMENDSAKPNATVKVKSGDVK